MGNSTDEILPQTNKYGAGTSPLFAVQAAENESSFSVMQSMTVTMTRVLSASECSMLQLVTHSGANGCVYNGGDIMDEHEATMNPLNHDAKYYGHVTLQA